MRIYLAGLLLAIPGLLSACAEAALLVGSYEFTTRAARPAGDLGPDERIYHTDLYLPDSHVLPGFDSAPPSYEEARAQALTALATR